MISKKTSALLIAALAFCACRAQDETPVGPSNTNLREYVLSALAEGQKNVSVPKGVYRLKPTERQHISLKNLDGVELDFGGSTLICLEPTRAVTLENCRDVKIKNLTIDYDPLPFTQGKIIEISADKLEHTIELFEGYAAAADAAAEKYEIFSPQTRVLRCSTYFGVSIEKISERVVKIIKPQSARNMKNQTEEVGDFVVMATVRKNSIPHAVVLERSDSCWLENITLFSANSFSFYEANCNSTVYKKCAVKRCPTQSDYAKRAEPRLRSGNADAFHSKFARKGPSYIDCESEFNGDDSIAINGSYNAVLEARGKTLRVFSKSRDMNIEAGDEMEIFLRGGDVRIARAAAVKKIGEASSEDLEELKTQKIWEFIMKGGAFKTEYEITLEKETEVEPLSMIASRNKIGAGFKIMGGRFGMNRSRGLIIKSSDGVISGVKIEGSWMAGILMAPEWFWLEAAHSANVVIENNEITAGAMEAINIHSPSAAGRGYSPAGAHKNINIRNNLIRYYYDPAFFITSVDGLKLSGNSFVKMDRPIYFVQEGGPRETIELVNVNED